MSAKVILLKEVIWNSLVKIAQKEFTNQGNNIRSFFLFSIRNKRLPIKIVDYKEMLVKTIKKQSPSGSIFIWDFKKKPKSEYYPPIHSEMRYCGTLIIQPNLDMTNHYAYWMAIDFSLRGGFHINLWINNGNPVYKAYAVGQIYNTYGEFIECRLQTF